jgi:hypothetical protein
MIDQFLTRYAACAGRQDRFQLRKWADERMTPLEVAALWGSARDLPEELRRWLSRFDHLPKPRNAEPQAYQAREIAPGMLFFAGGTGKRGTKCLLLAFATGMHGLLMPTACFLQYLPSTRFDVLMLQDKNRNHFEHGIRPYAGSMPELLRGLDADFEFSAYDALYCAGFSMGGFPALRAGRLTNARRAVSFGGRMPWHIRRLQRRNSVLPAFDPLCECMRRNGSDLVCVYGADHELDSVHAERLSRAYAVRRLPIIGVESHNPVFALAESGRLQGFLDAMFDIPGGESEADFRRADVERLVASVAR